MVLDRRRMPRLALLVAVAALAGCGIKGPLTLPPENGGEAKAGASKPATPAPPAPAGGSSRSDPRL